MQRTPMKAGIIGSGFAASFHVAVLRRVHTVDLEIAGVYSRNAERTRAFCEERGLTAIASLEELIDVSDVLHVCTPPATHEPLARTVLAAGKSVIIEKPFTGYFGDGSDSFSGETFPREDGLREAMASVERIREAERASAGTVFYAENWVYAPAIRKECEILAKAGGQILWIHGEEAHHGSHSPYYGIWKHSGGGSVMGKIVHPLTGALYLKQVEGRLRDGGSGKPIRPARVNCHTHTLTRMPTFHDAGHIRTGYTDTEDFGTVHVEFDDGTIADVTASEIKLGGVHNWLEVNATTHRTRVNINPNNAMQTYNPREEYFSDIYVVEKIGTKQGWAPTSPDEDWFTGYENEMNTFYEDAAVGRRPESGSLLGADTIAVVYAGYLSAERDGAAVEVPRVEL